MTEGLLCSKCGEHPRLNKDSYCRSCRNTYNREWHQNKPEKKILYRERLAELAAAGEYEPRAWEPGRAGRPPKAAT